MPYDQHRLRLLSQADEYALKSIRALAQADVCDSLQASVQLRRVAAQAMQAANRLLSEADDRLFGGAYAYREPGDVLRHVCAAMLGRRYVSSTEGAAA